MNIFIDIAALHKKQESFHTMEELVWHPDTALGLPINELGKTITEFVKKDPFQYGIDKQTTSVLNGIASILCSLYEQYIKGP